MNLLHPTQAFEEASGKEVKYQIKPRRPGDAAAVWAATETAEKVPSVPRFVLDHQSADATSASRAAALSM